MNKVKLIFISIVLVLTFVCSIFLYCINMHSSKGVQAAVYVAGEIYSVIDLSEDGLYKKYTIETEFGNNVIYVSEDGICVIEADCPDKTCINTGYSDNPAKPIICMPHRLEIVISGESVDGIAR